MEIKGKYNKAKIYTENIDEDSINQIYNLLNNPAFEKGSIAIMPDVHIGKGAVVGFTMELKQLIVPKVIGVDIGCGIDAYNLGKININLESFDNFIRKNVPSGRDVHKNYNKNVKIYNELERLLKKIKITELPRVMKSIGSLGVGNHFIELEKDKNDNTWLLIHSGSRGLGLLTAYYHQDRAKEYIKKIFKGAGAYYGLEYLDLNENGMEYLNDLKLVQEYASGNRKEMARIIIEDFLKIKFSKVDFISSIHNYYNSEDNIIRKGAISAKKGEKVVIPMNMRDGSVIAVGKGNEQWNYSAPHGAGRILKRGDAKEKLSIEEYKKSMNGIFSSCINEKTIDESPMAYKSAQEIQEKISDTVDIIEVMKPIYNFKASV